MPRKINTQEVLPRLGAQVVNNNEGVIIRGGQPNIRPPVSSQLNDSIGRRIPVGVSFQKFDAAVAYFESKDIPRNLAETYAAVLLDTSKATGKDVSELIETTASGINQFTIEAVSHINLLRPIYSQIGYKTATGTGRSLISRTILA